VKPYRVVENEERGWCIVAARDIEPLEIILVDTAVLVTTQQSSSQVCVGCFKGVDSVSLCHVCQHPVCGECGGEEHVEECGVLQGVRCVGDDSHHVVGILRLLSLRNTEDWCRIDNLLDRVSRKTQTDITKWKKVQTDIVDVIKTKKDVDDELLHHLYDLVTLHTVDLCIRKERLSRRALYPLLALVNHSCVSNASYAVNPDDLSVVLRAKKKIPEGEYITRSYVPAVYGVPKRRQDLSHDWGVTCHCERCSDVTEFGTFVSAFKCGVCGEGLILPQDTNGSVWKCRSCSNPYETEMIQKLLQNMEDQLHNISDISVKAFETFIKNSSKDLYMKHYLNLIAQRNMIEILAHTTNITREECRKSIRLCKSYMSTMSRLDPGYSEWKGSILKKLAKAQLELLKIDLQEKKIDRNIFSTKSEEIWKSMDEVDFCDILCMPLKGKR